MDPNGPAQEAEEAVELETVIDARPGVTQAHEGNDVVEGDFASGEDATAPPRAYETSINYPIGPKLYLSVASLYLALYLSGLDLTIVAIAVPSLTHDFQTLQDIGWYSSAYSLAAAAFIFLFGKAATVFPTKSVVLLGLVIFTTGSTIATFAHTSTVFIFGRAVTGLGISSLASGSNTILSHLFPKHRRSLWLGLASTSQSAGLVTGPVIGGALIDKFGWRACFGINIPLCPLCIVFAYFFLDDPVPNPGVDLLLKEKLMKLDPVGSILVIPSIVSLLMALQWGSVKYGWEDARILALFCVFAVLFLGFLYVQYKSGDQATVSFRILKRRGILAGLYFAACVNGVLATTEYYISIYWQGVRGVSATKSGLLSASMIVGLMIASLVAGAGTNLTGYFTPFMLGTSLFAPIFSGLLTTIGGSQQTAQVAVYSGFLGFGVGLGLMGPIQAVSFLLHPSEVSIGAAITGFGGTIGSALFLSVSATLFQNRLSAEIMRYAPSTDLSRLERAGLSNLRRVVVQEDLEAVLKAYGKAVDQTLYLPLALSCATIIGSAFMEWPNVKKKEE